MWIMEIIGYVLRLTIVVGLVIAVLLGIIIWTKKSSRKKAIRYFRWSVKAAFLLIFMIPVAYLLGAPTAPVYSFLFGGLNRSILMLPLGQSPCVIWLASWGQIHGTRIVDPIWGLQNVLAGQVEIPDLLPAIGAILLFLIPMIAITISSIIIHPNYNIY